MKRVAILGGGISGLASAYFLAKKGIRPVIFEASDRLGGLGTHFEHEGVTLDRFYHVILDSDDDLCGLISDVGLADRLIWRETGMGFHIGGRLYGFNGPFDVLRFGALPFADRLRIGLGALYVTQVKRRALDLDDVFAREWLPRIFGRRVYDRIWEPLLRAKFGERLGTVPAYWVWNTLTREKNGKQEVKGYLRGGYRFLAQTLAERIRSLGGEIRLACPARSIHGDSDFAAVDTGAHVERFDAALSTLPIPLTARLASPDLAASIPLPDLAYQGVVNAVVLLRKPLQRFYWTVVVDSSFEFQGVVETTHVIPSEWVGGRHLVYLMNYCDAASDLYARPDDLVRRQAVAGLERLYPRFEPSDVEEIYVFRAPHVEPAWTVGYLRKRPAARVAHTALYLATTAQAYPRVTAWNTSVAIARETTDALVDDLHRRTPAARAA